MLRIDAHLHFIGDHPDAIAMLEELDLKLLNITVAHGASQEWRKIDAEPYRKLAQTHPDRYAWCTSFDLPDFKESGYADRIIEGLDRDFAGGAVGCKVWKNIGMDLKDPAGRFVMVDDPIFEPIFQHLEQTHRTLLMHIAEPLACWEPLEKESPHQDYYRKNPQWHMCGRTDMPSHARLMAARDHVIERHSELRVIGAHLGSLEHDLNKIARRLDRYPNFAVDVSARTHDLTYHDRDIVREFFRDYQDRILYGSDIVMRRPLSTLDTDQRQAACGKMRANCVEKFTYYDTDETLNIRGREVQGLALPEDILSKFYTTNARAWYPGL